MDKIHNYNINLNCSTSTFYNFFGEDALKNYGVDKETVEELFRAPKTKEAKKMILNEFAHIKEMKGKHLIRVTFDGKSAFEPLIGNVVLEYKTPLNILYANTKTINGNAEGEMILQLPESKEISDRMVTYFKEKGLGVEEVDDYVR